MDGDPKQASASDRSAVVVPLSILALGVVLAIGLLIAQRGVREAYAEHVRSVAVGHEVIERAGGPGGEPRRRAVLEKLAADGDSLAGADLQGAALSRIDLRGGVLDFAVLDGAKLRDAQLEGASFLGAQMRGIRAAGAKAVGADFTGADLSGADFVDAELQRADFTQARLFESDFARARLDGAKFVRSYLVGSDLRGATLRGALLFESDLFEADLSAATLGGARLDGARLKLANLGGCDLREVGGLAFAQLRAACLDPNTTRLPRGLVLDPARYGPPPRCCELFPERFAGDDTGACTAVPNLEDDKRNLDATGAGTRG